MRALPVAIVALLVVLAGCGATTVTETPTDASTVSGTDATPTETATPNSTDEFEFEDPETDRLGWEGGLWYNESIDVDQSDGLNETELDLVVNRSMARVERVRGLEFDGSVPVEIVPREEFRENTEDRSTPDDLRRFDNVKFEALFMINESTDSIAVQQQNRGSSIGGFYSPGDERIVIVSENASSPKLSEITLAQELFHALQDQKFDISSYDQSTRERHNAIDGIIEGDGNYVDYLYQQRCEAGWNCLSDDAGGGGGGGLANIGPYLLTFQPYSDGPGFVQQLHEEEGWEAVNAIYETPPESTEQIIHPNKYPDEGPDRFEVADRTSGSWERMTVDGRPNYAELGEAGVATMLVYPLYDSDGDTAPVAPQEWLNYDSNGELRDIDPLNYNTSYTDGWAGDRLVAYQDDAGETGYAWELRWDSTRDAEEFLNGYEQVLDYRNASVVEDADGPGTVYRVPEDDPSEFSDAFRVVHDGDRVIIVNAPTVDDLDDVHAVAG